MLKKYKIKKRLTTAFIIIAIIASISGVVGCIAMNYIVSQYNYALQNYGFSQGDIGKVLVTFADARSATRAIIGYTDEDIINEQVKIHGQKKEACQKYMEIVKETLTSDEEITAYENASAAMKKYWEIDEKIIKLGNTTDPQASQQAQLEANNELSPMYDEAYSYLTQLMDLNINTGNDLKSSLENLRVILFIIIVLVIIVAMILSVMLGINIAKGIANPVTNLAKRLTIFAKGELTEKFPETDSNDEIADMVDIAKNMAKNLVSIINDAKYRLEEMAKGNYTVESKVSEKYVGEFSTLHTSIHDVNIKMNETLHQINNSATQVSASSGNMAQAAQSLAEGATEQAGAVEELLATITSLTENINQAAINSQGSYETACQYAMKANQSKEEMQGMVKTMKEIRETSKKIVGIIEEIEDIASQTNLLSFNASIEAARAGETGRGFAVVADQIGKLAEESAQSAQNTRDLIMNALERIENGTQIAEKTAISIDEVVDGINQVADNSKESTAQSKLQAESMKQAEQGVNQISEVIQANSAAAEESSATSEELSAQAEFLDSLVKQFVLRE